MLALRNALIYPIAQSVRYGKPAQSMNLLASFKAKKLVTSLNAIRAGKCWQVSRLSQQLSGGRCKETRVSCLGHQGKPPSSACPRPRSSPIPVLPGAKQVEHQQRLQCPELPPVADRLK